MPQSDSKSTERIWYEVRHQYQGHMLGEPLVGGRFYVDLTSPVLSTVQALDAARAFVASKPKRRGSVYVIVWVHERRTTVEITEPGGSA